MEIDQNGDVLDAIQLQLSFNNESDSMVKIDDNVTQINKDCCMTIVKPPFACKTCGELIFAYSARTVYGGFCYPCDVDAAFEAGKKRSESQAYSYVYVLPVEDKNQSHG